MKPSLFISSYYKRLAAKAIGTKMWYSYEKNIYLVNKKSGEATLIVFKNQEKNVTLPDVIEDKSGRVYTLTQIGSGVFKKNRHLKSIKLPSSIRVIGKYAFFGCNSLKDLNFEELHNLKEIQQYAFACCDKLEHVRINSQNLEVIEASAFGDCRHLSTVKIDLNQSQYHRCLTIKEKSFAGCISLTHFAVYATQLHLDNNVFKSCCRLSNLVLPSYIFSPHLKARFFNDCVQLKTIELSGERPKDYLFDFGYIDPLPVTDCVTLVYPAEWTDSSVANLPYPWNYFRNRSPKPISKYILSQLNEIAV